MSLAYTVKTKSEWAHVVSWPDGVQVEIVGKRKLAIEIGKGRALVRKLWRTANATEAVTRRSLDALKDVELALNDIAGAIREMVDVRDPEEKP